jgi:hypothetical protein
MKTLLLFRLLSAWCSSGDARLGRLRESCCVPSESSFSLPCAGSDVWADSMVPTAVASDTAVCNSSVFCSRGEEPGVACGCVVFALLSGRARGRGLLELVAGVDSGPASGCCKSRPINSDSPRFPCAFLSFLFRG